MAPLIRCSMSSSMFKYFLVDHAVPAICRRRAAARLRADWPSGNAPTTRVRRLISRKMRSSGLLVLMRRQCSCSSSVSHESCCRKLSGPGQPQCVQLLDHLQSLLARRRKIFARVDCLEHRRNLADLGRGDGTEDVAVPMDNASLPRRFGEKLAGTLVK